MEQSTCYKKNCKILPYSEKKSTPKNGANLVQKKVQT